MNDELTSKTAGELAGLIRVRKLSPVELVEATLARVDALQPRLNAFITITAESARAAARAAEARIMRDEYLGPLHGLPFSVKDLTPTRGVRTTLGSRYYEHTVPAENAIPVQRLLDAGAILIGKTTTPEFGHKPLTESPLFGRTLNPWNPAFTCGGSSGGAAVAVASGMGPLALGTDGGGSVRIPASCCGVVGLKPTPGVIPNAHTPDAFGNNSFVGPLARCVDDARLLLDAMRGPDARDPFGLLAAPVDESARPVRGLRIAWLERVGNAELDGQVAALTESVLELLREAGATVKPLTIDFAALEPAFLVFLQTALASRLGEQVRERPELFDPGLLVTVEAGRGRSGVELQQANAQRTRLFRELQGLFQRFDLLCSPTLAAPPLPVEQDPHGKVIINAREAGLIRGGWYPYTFPLNLSGHPAITIPCGLAGSGLPVGCQLIGPWYGEGRLFDAARYLEHGLADSKRWPGLPSKW